MKEYDEHVNDHQVNFCREVAKRNGNIIEIEDIEKLKECIVNYKDIVKDMNNEQNSNNKNFCEKFSALVEEILK